MSKIAVVYWSGTGNTEAMAQCVAQGVTEAGAECELLTADKFNAGMVSDYSAIAFGCPSMGSEQLEEYDFEPMFSACKSALSGKRIALFGSYGWGDGAWMRTWEEDCRGCGANLVFDSVICCETPDDGAKASCVALGKALV